jgi:predicted nuclease of predicted toxin-antitoxin system
MAALIRFHLDEHIDPAIADGLRRRGIDVTTTVGAELLEANDDDHLAFARQEERVIVTQDQDFLRQHRQEVPHSGIAYCHLRSRNAGEILRSLILIWEILTPEEMEGHVEYL